MKIIEPEKLGPPWMERSRTSLRKTSLELVKARALHPNATVIKINHHEEFHYRTFKKYFFFHQLLSYVQWSQKIKVITDTIWSLILLSCISKKWKTSQYSLEIHGAQGCISWADFKQQIQQKKVVLCSLRIGQSPLTNLLPLTLTYCNSIQHKQYGTVWHQPIQIHFSW